MKQLEYKKITPYLPFDILVMTPDGLVLLKGLDRSSFHFEHLDGGIGMYDSDTFGWFWQEEDHFKPILRPLSDLGKDMKYGTQEITPSKYLADYHIFSENTPSEHVDSVHKRFLDQLKQSISLSESRYWIMEFLFEWHFDVFGLIEAGLAIDINTLKDGRE